MSDFCTVGLARNPVSFTYTQQCTVLRRNECVCVCVFLSSVKLSHRWTCSLRISTILDCSSSGCKSQSRCSLLPGAVAFNLWYLFLSAKTYVQRSGPAVEKLHTFVKLLTYNLNIFLTVTIYRLIQNNLLKQTLKQYCTTV